MLRTILCALGLVVVIFLSGMPDGGKPKDGVLPLGTASYAVDDEEEGERWEENISWEEWERRKQVLMENALTGALDSIGQFGNQVKYEMEYLYSDTLYEGYEVGIRVRINSGYHFGNGVQHVMVRKGGVGRTHIDVLAKRDGGFKKVIGFEEPEGLSYEEDTIRDVNGDGRKDFVVSLYGKTGCCLKGFRWVYLLRGDHQAFSEGIEFINPTFSPREGIIRGICYGHPGHTEVYKYRWRGERVDTVEYVYYERDTNRYRTGEVIVSNHRPYHEGHKVLRRLKEVPTEYARIDDYDWFEASDCMGLVGLE